MSAGRSLLPWIVAFKAAKTLALTALGVTLLVTRHADPVDVVMRLWLAFHLPFTSRVFDRALNLAFNATPAKEVGLAVTAFGYAVLMGTEGTGLYLRKPWARWFTIAATGSLIPLEIYEIVRDAHFLRILVLVANVAIVGYLFVRKEIFE